MGQLKKYKLIKTYPGSPKLGEIRTGSNENERYYPTEKCMENNPEYWEEVIEKSYEIHSVKRLSDGEIFTVGDMIKLSHNIRSKPSKIEKILILGDGRVDFENDRGGGIYMNVAEKVDSSIFTTEDGVYIYEGEMYF